LVEGSPELLQSCSIDAIYGADYYLMKIKVCAKEKLRVLL